MKLIEEKGHSIFDPGKVIVVWVLPPTDPAREQGYHASGYLAGHHGPFGASKELYFTKGEYEAIRSAAEVVLMTPARERVEVPKPKSERCPEIAKALNKILRRTK